MAPKKGKNAKGKKGAGSDDDAHWDKIAAAKEAATPTAALDHEDSDEEASIPVSKSKSTPKFALPPLEDEPSCNDEDEDDSLMATLKKNSASNSKKKAKGKKNKPDPISDDDAEPAEDKDNEFVATETRGVVEVNADDWMEAEFGETKAKKPKKGKKGGKSQQQRDNEEDEADPVDVVSKGVEKIEIAAVVVEKPVKEEQDVEEEETGSKVLSKSEKEKLKKEKEKAKKKAQAAAKKQQSASTAPVAESESTPAVPVATLDAAEGGEEEEGEDADDGGASSKKKKKKNKKVVEKKVEAPATTKKATGQLSALRALVEAQKAAAEESERLIREHREKIEAEDRRIEEEEKLAAEEKARRKEKEKAKKDQLRKEGKLLTPKQKADRAAAEIRLKALIGTAGNTIAGLQESARGDDSAAPKKVSYAKKKPFKKVAIVEEKIELKVEVEVEAIAEEKIEIEDEDDVKDDWDASDEEAKVPEKAESVKDDWDASESEEEMAAPVTAVTSDIVPAAPKVSSAANGAKPAAKSSKAPIKSSSAPKAAPDVVKSLPSKPVAKSTAKPAAQNGKVVAAPVESESESEEDDATDSDDDSDDSDDSGSDESDSDGSSEDEEGLTHTQRMFALKKAEAKERRLKKEAEALAARSKDNMRSPICVILGHVDTGKTKLLDKIRQTNVQEGEAGGITQQIGATYFPMDTIRSKTIVLGDADLKEYRLPGLLVIDTPGHESFTNLRTRGSSLCNIAILVVDIMHGLEPQTLESLRLLRDGKTPFIVALNKIDRLYGWKQIPDGGFQASLAAQAESVQREYKNRLNETMLAFAEQGLNSLPYYENKDFGRIVSLVPTSAHTGEGVPDMLMLIVKLTQEKMTERLMYLSTLEATVLEVKVIEGLGATIDVVLSNGVLHEGDRIVICGLNGAIVTTIRALLTPQPLKELRIKGSYVHHKEVKASLGIKIVAPDLEKAIAGSRLLVLGEDDDEDELREDIMSDLTNLMESVDKSGLGVSVQASTLGSLEALLEFLKTSKIPVSSINIGPVHKSDIMRSVRMLEKAKELAVILCFDVPVDKEAEKIAEEFGIRVFKADIIYHLFDAFTAYNASVMEQKKADAAPKAVWPCRLKTIACFARGGPIILGVDIIEGTLRIGTPLCVVKTDPETKKKTVISLGKVTSLEINHKVLQIVKKDQAGGGVAVKIECASYETVKQYGRQFDDTDEIISMISRNSIDTLVQHFRSEVTKDDLQLLVKLKSKLDVPDK